MLTNTITFLLGTASGHSYARVVTVEKRVEVPTPACRDEMIRIEDDERKHISCTHPDHHGEFKNVMLDKKWDSESPYLICTCPHAQLELNDGGVK